MWRFGKSMAADMLAAYYSKGCDSAGLFAGRKAEKAESFKKHLNRHNVIRLDVQRFVETGRDLDTFIREMERRVVSELAREFPEWGEQDPGGRLKDVLEQIFYETGQEFLNVVDGPGWDGLIDALERSKGLLAATWCQDGKSVAEGMAKIHNFW